MANIDNSCSKLKIENLYPTSTTHLKDILDLQADTQKNVYGWNFEKMSIKDLVNFWHMNSHALQDEIHEATDALGGIKDGIGNAAWKPWKKDHNKAQDMKLSDLSEDDLLELKFEIVDILHFFMNMAASVNMTAEEMYDMYMSKNSHNRDRQKNGY